MATTRPEARAGRSLRALVMRGVPVGGASLRSSSQSGGGASRRWGAGAGRVESVSPMGRECARGERGGKCNGPVTAGGQYSESHRGALRKRRAKPWMEVGGRPDVWLFDLSPEG